MPTPGRFPKGADVVPGVEVQSGSTQSDVRHSHNGNSGAVVGVAAGAAAAVAAKMTERFPIVPSLLIRHPNDLPWQHRQPRPLAETH